MAVAPESVFDPARLAHVCHETSEKCLLPSFMGIAVTSSAPLAVAPAFLRIRDVLRITSLSRPTLYRRIAARRFPPPVHLGGRACGWSSTALQAWINDPEGYCAPVTVGVVEQRRRGRPLKYPEFRGR